ncbi:hypothetical protein CANARDRAFT_27417 [[Candida] arabinofermentans NRRL YB-2248]|uniref:ethanolamine-phosphate cytidylyltransferase n=1 Tax=[Candida] arabinofermentans NRRL YB-2248 TaxID=983967 RepID=A0A1E4T360_9ASCO|nr:hypothetical protein CANARDRAFT_27417 [[Candida] arabinofermentans NRRL YB-2248]
MTDSELLDTRIWIDGCFDFAHHGHAGAMLQARQHGDELYVGVHSDEDILYNKGPVVMKLQERLIAVEGCRWCTKVIPNAPYVTDPQVLNDYHCKFVVHGDDITTDANGFDCYQTMKDLGRFIVVKRTPNISTTDLVGRMLTYSKQHHLQSLKSTNLQNHQLLNDESLVKFKSYSTSSDGLSDGVAVFYYTSDDGKLHELIKPNEKQWNRSPNIYFIDGGFDLFNPGHITALRNLKSKASQTNSLILVGLNDDLEVNLNKGLNYPIMNLFERSLCVLQSKYIDGIIIGSPYKPTLNFLNLIPNKTIIKVFHGPTDEVNDPYTEIKQHDGLFEQLENHPFSNITTEVIVKRVLDNRLEYEERQKRKGWKSEHEKLLEANEKLKDEE